MTESQAERIIELLQVIKEGALITVGLLVFIGFMVTAILAKLS